MTQAFNLSQLANNINTSGQLDATDGLTGTIPDSNLPTISASKGGTGQTTLTANNVLLGNGTSAVQFVAPSTSGNVLVSNGTTWVSQAPAGGGVTSLNGQTGAITNTAFNSIGSYALVMGATPQGTNYSTNSTYSGTTLRVSTIANLSEVYASYGGNNQPLSGTWRMMGGGGGSYYQSNCGVQSGGGPVLFVRVS